MAKQKKEEPKNDFFVGTDEVIEAAKNQLVVDSISTLEFLDELEKTYLNVEIKDIEDLASYNFVVDGYKKSKDIRVKTEKRRKEITRPALDFQREVKKVADTISERVSVVENHLLEQKTAFEDKKKAEEERLFREKCDKLTSAGWQLFQGNYVLGAVHLSPDQVQDMDDDVLNFNINLGKEEQKRKKAEADRIAKEKKEAEEAKLALQKEREELAKEREEMAKAMAELNAQKEALAKEYKAVEKSEESKIETKPNKTEEKPAEEPSKPIDKSKPATEDNVIRSKEFHEGFEHFRSKMMVVLKDKNNQLTRNKLINWVEKLIVS